MQFLPYLNHSILLMAVIALDLGGTKLAAALFNDKGNILFKTNHSIDKKQGAEVGKLISQAANDLRKFRHARRGVGYSLYADARNWITSNDRKWPYSFLNLCDVLHLAADAIRAELLGNTSGHPSLKSRTT